jgi:hypothetical protein
MDQHTVHPRSGVLTATTWLSLMPACRCQSTLRLKCGSSIHGLLPRWTSGVWRECIAHLIERDTCSSIQGSPCFMQLCDISDVYRSKDHTARWRKNRPGHEQHVCLYGSERFGKRFTMDSLLEVCSQRMGNQKHNISQSCKKTKQVFGGEVSTLRPRYWACN